MFLPICGIELPYEQKKDSSPYKPAYDSERAWTREVCLRFLQLHDMRKACMYLSSFEQQFAQWHAKNCPDSDRFSSFKFDRNSTLNLVSNTRTVDVTNYLTYMFNTDRFPDTEVEGSKI